MILSPIYYHIKDKEFITQRPYRVDIQEGSTIIRLIPYDSKQWIYSYNDITDFIEVFENASFVNELSAKFPEEFI